VNTLRARERLEHPPYQAIGVPLVIAKNALKTLERKYVRFVDGKSISTFVNDECGRVWFQAVRVTERDIS
jgi:hypothetical protein